MALANFVEGPLNNGSREGLQHIVSQGVSFLPLQTASPDPWVSYLLDESTKRSADHENAEDGILNPQNGWIRLEK